MNLFDQRQFEEAAVNDAAAAARAHVDAAVIDLHTSCPGTVESFDSGKQTATVRPGIQKLFRDKGMVAMPALMDVPVQFPRGGGFVMTFPVKQGDECLLVFSERAIDNWHASGGVQPPSDYRTHSLSDAFAIMGVSSIPKSVSDFNTGAVELRALDGGAKIQIADGGDISIESSSGNVSVQSGGMVRLNAPSTAIPLTDGVLTGSLMCPILGAPHGTLGPVGVAQKVVAR